MYNLKVTKFPSGVTRVQYYEYVVSPSEKEKKSEKLVENPFNSDLVREVEQFSDRSHSLCESLRRTRAMVYNYSLANDWDWFVTLTFDPQKVDRYNYSDCAKKLKNFIDVTRRKCPGLNICSFRSCIRMELSISMGLLPVVTVWLLLTLALSMAAVRFIISLVIVMASPRPPVYQTPAVPGPICPNISQKSFARSPPAGNGTGPPGTWSSRQLKRSLWSFMPPGSGILDEIYDVSSYYKRLVSPDQERISHFYEFPPDVDIGIRNFMPWVYSA